MAALLSLLVLWLAGGWFVIVRPATDRPSHVDAILVFDDVTPERVLAAVKPDVHVKGSDYAGKSIPERAIVEAYGGRVELVPLVPGRSTTSTLDKLRK